MLRQRTFEDLLSATFSPGSASGATHSDRPIGPTTNRSGQAPALASLSARQAREKGLLTRDTSGPPSTGSSASVNLTSLLVSRLQEKLASRGSTLYRLTWKRRTTPAGRSHSRLAVSVLRTNDSDCTGWLTPNRRDANSEKPDAAEREMNRIHAGGMPNLTVQVHLATWPTPTARDHKDGQECQNVPINSLLGRDVWQTIREGPARLTATGLMLTGSSAGTNDGGPLNPAHSRWLMALPHEWDDCAVTAMQSLRNKRKSSSRP